MLDRLSQIYIYFPAIQRLLYSFISYQSFIQTCSLMANYFYFCFQVTIKFISSIFLLFIFFIIQRYNLNICYQPTHDMPATLYVYITILISTILLQSSALRVNQTHTTEEVAGTWTNTIDVSIGDLPSQYFMCGFAFLQSHFQITRCNCRCGRRCYRGRYIYRCNQCQNDVYQKASGFKIVFCRYNKWEDKIERVFETSSPSKYKWRPTVMCPENTFVNGFSGAYGVMQGHPLGFHGLKIKCSTTDLKHSNYPEDRYTYYGTPFHNARPGNFVSGVKIKYNQTSILFGITFIYEPMVIINKIVIDYKNDSAMENYPVTIDTVTVKNNGSKSAIKKVGSNKTYESAGRWINNNPVLHKYNVEKGIIITPPNMANSSDKIQNSIYQIYTQNFGFDRQIKTTISSIEELLVTVPSYTEIIINKIVYQQRGTLFFKGSVYFVNMLNNDPVMSTDISGSWEGVTNRGVVNEIQERKLNQKENKESKNNASQENTQKQDIDKKQVQKNIDKKQVQVKKDKKQDQQSKDKTEKDKTQKQNKKEGTKNEQKKENNIRK